MLNRHSSTQKRQVLTLLMVSLFSRRLASAFVYSPRYKRTISTFVARRSNNNAGSQASTLSQEQIWQERTIASTQIFSTASKPDDATEVTPTPPQVPRKFQPWPFQYHEELTLTVEALTNRGIGVCRASISATDLPADRKITSEEESDESLDVENKGWVVFVPSVIPGETVRCRIYRNFRSYSEADLIEVIDKSAQRVEPVCPLFAECGGCQYQHMDISIQREWKTSQVQELLERVGKLDPDSFPSTKPTVGTDEVYNYRSKITPHYDKPIKTENGIGDLKIRAIGFKKKTNRQLVDVPLCHIATDRINEKLADYREEKFLDALEGRLKKRKKGATLLLRDALIYDGAGEDSDVEPEPIVETDHNVYVKTIVKDLTFRFLAGNFFQNNPYMLPVMVDHVLEAATPPNTAGNQMTHLIDCYCGSGLFCLSASKEFDVCVGIELNAKAVQEAQFNANLNQISNCKFVAASAEAIFLSKDPVEVVTKETDPSTGQIISEALTSTLVKDFPTDTTVVVIDPPRKGCSEEFLEQLYNFSPARVVYMSCDPATQARDTEGIVGAGYSILIVQPFDLFPQTRHIESLIVFEKEVSN
mmetsp:Transcript_5010/g.7053  ORF Transcript_5010/g.7053 Transcript_5010/m.7053 type:complete len:589 (+) Transcript_5010:63-1829(+)